MRKKLILIIVLLLPIINIEATSDSYYSNYSDYSPYTDEIIENNDLIDVRKTYMYKYYKEEKKYGDYYIIGKHNAMFPYVEGNDYIKTKTSEWSENKPSSEIGRSIQSRDVYYYQNMKKIRYIHFDDIRGGRDQLNINEIIITSNNRDIAYTIDCNGCSDNFHEKVTNKKINYENSYLLFGGYLIIDLGDYYSLSGLSLKFYITDTSTSEKRYHISTTRGGGFDDNRYSEVLSRIYFTHSSNNEYKEIYYELDKLNIVKPDWEDVIKSYTPVAITPTRKVEQRKEYSYQDTLYRHFNYEKVYCDGYYENSPHECPLVDKDDYLIYYQSRYRDKVTIKSKIVIDDYNQKIEDFVLENTTNKLQINGDINYNKNGIYDVKYIFPFIEIEKLVYVNILANEVIVGDDEGEGNSCECSNKEEDIVDVVEQNKPPKPKEDSKPENMDTDSLEKPAKKDILGLNNPIKYNNEINIPNLSDNKKEMKKVKEQNIDIKKETIEEVKTKPFKYNYFSIPLILLIIFSVYNYYKNKVNKKSE